jgi:hypothetical protein
MGLDEWITGNYGEDQFKNVDSCHNCIYYAPYGVPEDGGTCICVHSPYFDRDVELDEYCDYHDSRSPQQDEPDDFDERRCEDD